MRKLLPIQSLILIFILFFTTTSCNQESKTPSEEVIKSINLKSGELVLCGPADKQFGSVAFETSCGKEYKRDFDLGIALLHSFEYDEAEKVFAKIIENDPRCAMAYWGVAMSNYHLLWTPPSTAELTKGWKAIQIAMGLPQKSKEETDYINAASQLYQDWEKVDHKTRCLRYEKAMEKVHLDYPANKEAAALYALALNASAEPSDTSFRNQRKAGAILDALYPGELNHPGIVHYIIHTYDNPELAKIALPAARRYASVAPSSAHALHMPSHIFTRMGLWDESINSNLNSVSSAKCYAEQTGIKGHWDEELHGLDYLVYAYLQKGDNIRAKQQLDYLKTIHVVNPTNFKVAYAFAAIPSRYLLENKRWNEAASLVVAPANFQWKEFPWQEAIIHFTRALGSVQIGQLDSARAELKTLKDIQALLLKQKDAYKASQVQIQVKAAEAWINFKEGKTKDALTLMHDAAEMEDHTQKHPVTPGEVVPARELLGDMLLQLNKPAEALGAYEQSLAKHPNRFNSLNGAGLAAEKSNNAAKARVYFQKLSEITSTGNSDRPELDEVKRYLKEKS